jgi:hypothetical protein
MNSEEGTKKPANLDFVAVKCPSERADYCLDLKAMRRDLKKLS